MGYRSVEGVKQCGVCRGEGEKVEGCGEGNNWKGSSEGGEWREKVTLERVMGDRNQSHDPERLHGLILEPQIRQVFWELC